MKIHNSPGIKAFFLCSGGMTRLLPERMGLIKDTKHLILGGDPIGF